MSTLAPSEANWLADAQAGRISHISLHVASTGTLGSNEASGGTYARQAATWSASGAAGPLGASLQPATVGVAWTKVSFPGLIAGTYTDIGCWSALTGGTFRGGDDMSAAQVLADAGAVYDVSIKVGPGA